MACDTCWQLAGKISREWTVRLGAVRVGTLHTRRFSKAHWYAICPQNGVPCFDTARVEKIGDHSASLSRLFYWNLRKYLASDQFSVESGRLKSEGLAVRWRRCPRAVELRRGTLACHLMFGCLR